MEGSAARLCFGLYLFGNRFTRRHLLLQGWRNYAKVGGYRVKLAVFIQFVYGNEKDLNTNPTAEYGGGVCAYNDKVV